MGYLLEIYTTKHIGTKDYASNFMDILENYGLQLNKI